MVCAHLRGAPCSLEERFERLGRTRGPHTPSASRPSQRSHTLAPGKSLVATDGDQRCGLAKRAGRTDLGPSDDMALERNIRGLPASCHPEGPSAIPRRGDPHAVHHAPPPRRGGDRHRRPRRSRVRRPRPPRRSPRSATRRRPICPVTAQRRTPPRRASSCATGVSATRSATWAAETHADDQASEAVHRPADGLQQVEGQAGDGRAQPVALEQQRPRDRVDVTRATRRLTQCRSQDLGRRRPPGLVPHCDASVR